jgi:hypothetical protein
MLKSLLLIWFSFFFNFFLFFCYFIILILLFLFSHSDINFLFVSQILKVCRSLRFATNLRRLEMKGTILHPFYLLLILSALKHVSHIEHLSFVEAVEEEFEVSTSLLFHFVQYRSVNNLSIQRCAKKKEVGVTLPREFLLSPLKQSPSSLVLIFCFFFSFPFFQCSSILSHFLFFYTYYPLQINFFLHLHTDFSCFLQSPVIRKGNKSIMCGFNGKCHASCVDY